MYLTTTIRNWQCSIIPCNSQMNWNKQGLWNSDFRPNTRFPFKIQAPSPIIRPIIEFLVIFQKKICKFNSLNSCLTSLLTDLAGQYHFNFLSKKKHQFIAVCSNSNNTASIASAIQQASLAFVALQTILSPQVLTIFTFLHVCA